MDDLMMDNLKYHIVAIRNASNLHILETQTSTDNLSLLMLVNSIEEYTSTLLSHNHFW